MLRLARSHGRRCTNRNLLRITTRFVIDRSDRRERNRSVLRVVRKNELTRGWIWSFLSTQPRLNSQSMQDQDSKSPLTHSYSKLPFQQSHSRSSYRLCHDRCAHSSVSPDLSLARSNLPRPPVLCVCAFPQMSDAVSSPSHVQVCDSSEAKLQ